MNLKKLIMGNTYLIQLKSDFMGKFKFTDLDIEGMFIVEPTVFEDNRGYFMETYNDFAKKATQTLHEVGKETEEKLANIETNNQN